MWGMFVMAGTGLMAWFKVGVGERVPGWWIDVAITIHWYEAVLATLAIIVWHLYGVMFDPDAYPMNWAWFDGKMSIEHYEHEHPLDMLAIEKAMGSEPRSRPRICRWTPKTTRMPSRSAAEIVERCGTQRSSHLRRGDDVELCIANDVNCDNVLRDCTRR